MVEEVIPNPPSASAVKVKRLSKELRGLRGKFEAVEKRLQERKKKVGETVEYIRERANPQAKLWYLLVQFRNGDWIQRGVFGSPEELKREVNTIKDLRRKKNSNIKNYYVTDSEREMRRIVKMQVHREKTYHEEMKKELRGQPYSRYSENIRAGLKVPDEKAISKEVAQYSGYSGKLSGMMPRMAVGAWGSISQPRKTNLPSFGAPGRTTRQPVKRQIVPHDEYKALLDQGYTREALSERGIEDKYSRFYSDESIFPGAVSYKPVGLNQVFVNPPLPKSEYQNRIARGETWQGFKPPIAEIDPVTGKRKSAYKWNVFRW